MKQSFDINQKIVENEFNIKRIHKVKFKQTIKFLLLFIFCCFAIFQTPLKAQSRTVTLGVYENAPKVFTNSEGKPDGVFIDIIKAIAQKEGWKLQYEHASWAHLLKKLEIGAIDLMPDVAFTTTRTKRFDFHKEPVLASWYQIYIPENSDLNSLLDLDKKRILVLEQSVQQESFSKMCKGFGIECQIDTVPDYAGMFAEVSKGNADAAISNRFYGLMHAKKYDLKETTIVFEPSELFYAAPKLRNQFLLDAIDSHLKLMKQNPDSVYFNTLKKWTTDEPIHILPPWLGTLFAIALAIISISLLGSLALKHQVNKKTLELQNLNKEMEDRILQRTKELETAMIKAQAADHLKSSFLATMSHELRTPLNSIIGFTGILLQELPGPLNQEQQKQMGMIKKSSRHLLALINDVLDISKIEAGQLKLDYSEFLLPESIKKVVEIVKPIAAGKNLNLCYDIADNVGIVEADKRRIEQILLNLINNAIKFTEQGKVEIDCRIDKGHCILTITDTGPGIEEKKLTELFQPFHQIDTGLARKHEGTGLGLSICKKLLDLMQGTIHVESTFKKGSSFIVTFPVTKGDNYE
jgi:hypothetical protein